MRQSPENTREYWEDYLAREEAFLQRLEEEGVEALSSWDRTIAGDEGALRTALFLTRNHIAYAKKQLAQFRQASLF